MKNDEELIRDLRHRFNSGESLKFVHFWGHRATPGAVTTACFSQWYASPFVVDGVRYPTAEHFMMAEKARIFGDSAIREMVLGAPDPGAAKAFGRKLKNFDDAIWKSERFDTVCRANRAKFGQNDELKLFLIGTRGKILVEASPRDRIWGIGMGASNEGANNPNLWRGLNLLGFALTKVRDEMVAVESGGLADVH